MKNVYYSHQPGFSAVFLVLHPFVVMAAVAPFPVLTHFSSQSALCFWRIGRKYVSLG